MLTIYVRGSVLAHPSEEQKPASGKARPAVTKVIEMRLRYNAQIVVRKGKIREEGRKNAAAEVRLLVPDIPKEPQWATRLSAC